MRYKFCLLTIVIIFSSFLSYSQDAWELINAGFQEYFAQEKFELALKMAEQEFEYANNNETPIYQKAFSCSDVGISLFALKKYKEAEKYMLMSIDYNLEMSGKDSDNTLTELNQLAMNYAAMEKISKADSLLRIIIDSKERKHGRENEETLDAVQSLIKMHDAQGNLLEVSKLRAFYNIPEPDCKCPGKEKAKADSIKALEDIIKEPIANIDSLQSDKDEKPTSEPSKPGLTHTVKKGETLYAISLKYKITVADLKKRNNLKSNFLKVGQKLIVKKN
jgi:tetratricopeptide (TPR) repeat protein